MIQSFIEEFPKITEFPIHPLNKEVSDHLRLFVNDPNILISSLIQNPFGNTEDIPKIEELLNTDIGSIIKILNQLHDQDEDLIAQFHEYKPVVILFLINYFIYFKHQDEFPEINTALKKSKVEYGMKLLELMDISELRSELEDKFFSLLEPEVFHHYIELLKFTKSHYYERESEIKEKMESLLRSANIKFKIQSRIKSIYSIHRKILKKKILYSQILDTVGFRIVVDSEKDCYSTMAVILKNWPIMSNKVKDYIAVPKANGYKSIHLTILEKEQPVEIQIRTKEMNDYAQYGIAAHHQYKKSK